MTLFEDFLPNYSLAAAVEYAILEYQKDFGHYWGLDSEFVPEGMDPDDWEEYRRLYGQIERLAVAAKRLVRPRQLPDAHLSMLEVLRREVTARQTEIDTWLESIKDTAPDDLWWELADWLAPRHPADPRTKLDFVQHAMEIHAAREFVDDPAEFAKRMFSLLTFLARDPGGRTAAYLSRVAECYIRGMKPEFAVMCRAVLDAAIQEIVDDDDVLRRLPPEKRSFVGLAARIRYCQECGIFDAGEASAAEHVKVASDNAVHQVPGLEPDPDALLTDLTTALRALERAKRSRT